MTRENPVGSLDFATLHAQYNSRALTVTDVITAVYERIAAFAPKSVWIHLLPKELALARACALDDQFLKSGSIPAGSPLFGLPFAIKDNIDLEGAPTTAACPEYAYLPKSSAPVVRRLIGAGAIPIGKTNLDQFATGLSGVRSPYGACQNTFNPEYISGGSSSGSAVAVAGGLVSFSLGTDTAGSGRVPAAFNNIVGLKPSKGLLSTRGVVPACRSLDCVSIFALNCDDARRAAAVAKGFDAGDFFSRECADQYSFATPSASENLFRFGVPAAADLEFFGDGEAAVLFAESVQRLTIMGGTPVEISYAPFREAASLLYNGPWVAERLAGLKDFLEKKPGAFHPVTLDILRNGAQYTAVDFFQARARLEVLKQLALAEWQKMDLLLLPTAGTIYTIKAMESDPVRLNTNLGHYTNFVNLLDCCAIAVPAGFRKNGLPFGITFIAPALKDAELCALGARYHAELGGKLGATTYPLGSTCA